MKRRTFLRDLAGWAAGALLLSPAGHAAQPASRVSDATLPAELWRLSAARMHSLILRKKVSVTEMIRAHLTRMRALNPDVNAVTQILEEQALALAARQDRDLAAGRAHAGALFGVPFSVKENVDLAGSATTEGVRLLENNVVSEDSPHVALLKESGAIPLARTNMPDFGLRYHTDSDLHGATLNPWNHLLTPGGSSGGDAVAVATGMVPIGLGNDYGGSIRYPAQCSGVCGLRPSRGRVPFLTRALSRGSIPQSLTLCAVQGVLARCIGDLRQVLAIISKRGDGDSNWVPAPLAPPPPKKLRIAMVMNPAGLGVDDSVKEGVQRAAGILEKSGAAVEEIDSSSLEESADLWLQIVVADLRTLFLESIQQNASPGARKFVDQMIALSGGSESTDYVRNLARVNGIAGDWARRFQRFDAILGPVSSRNPFAVGSDILGVDAARTLLNSMVLTVTINLLGLPSVAIPVMITEGIPQAVQIAGPLFSETRCLDLAQLIEDEIGVFTPIDPVGLKKSGEFHGWNSTSGKCTEA